MTKNDPWEYIHHGQVAFPVNTEVPLPIDTHAFSLIRTMTKQGVRIYAHTVENGLRLFKWCEACDVSIIPRFYLSNLEKDGWTIRI